MHELILVLDFGSQYTQLIARRIREQNVYCEIYPFNISIEKIMDKKPKGIVLSGGPRSVYEDDAPMIDKEVFELGVPVLGICYGQQIIAHLFGGEVAGALKREYGKAVLSIDSHKDLFKDVGDSSTVWMSHGDRLERMPGGFEVIAHTDNSPFAAIRGREGKIYGIQFHLEVIHTEEGEKILENFLFDVIKCSGDWTPESFVNETVKRIADEVGEGKVICALSGGVDSSVTALLLNRAVCKNFTCIFVDNGLLRKGEKEQVEEAFNTNFKIDLRVVDASKRFLDNLKGVTDPEEKRKRIGNTFIEIFEEESKKLGRVDFLAQGTLYPDLIESQSFKGPSFTIKTHHNVGGLHEKMKLKLVEPLRELFKDEVRKVGKELELPLEILRRHPFPGPGLAVRIMGEVTEERADILRDVDVIYIDEIKRAGLYDEIWQAFAVLLPVKSVGGMGDSRTYENVTALRAVTSLDGMTADWYRMPHDVLQTISNRIINEVRGVNRVVYDVSSKPPSTIEWE